MKKAMTYYSRAADQDYTLAITALGRIELYGLNGTANYDKAYEHLVTASESGFDDNADHLLGQLYLSGLGCTQDDELAFKLFLSTEHLPESRYQLGCCRFLGA